MRHQPITLNERQTRPSTNPELFTFEGNGAPLAKPLKAMMIVDFHPEVTRVWSEPLGLDHRGLKI